MRALVQRVSEGGVKIDNGPHTRIGRGFVVLLGIRSGDTPDDADYLADKCAALRIFDDVAGKMNLGLKDIDGEVLAISQFTLYGETRRGNRPSFTGAAPAEIAEPLYDRFVQRLRFHLGEKKVATGVFKAMMHVSIENDGPVTILVESP